VTIKYIAAVLVVLKIGNAIAYASDVSLNMMDRFSNIGVI